MSNTKAQLQAVLTDPVAFISRLKIINKDGRLVSLKPNDEQIKIIQALEEGRPTLILKGRQIGSSTIVAAYFFWKIYTSVDPTVFAILSHKLASSKHLLGMHKTFYENLPGFLKKDVDVNNTIEIRFKDSGARILAASAGAEGGIRSFTCSYLHISEYTFSPNPDELKATALSALNSGQLVIESTASHFNDALHKEWTKWERGEADWNALFFPWFDHKEYRSDPPKDFQLTEIESALISLYGLSIEQIHWRRNKISFVGLEKFTREYPACVEDSYSQTSNSYFSHDDFKDIQKVPVEAVEFIRFAPPDKDDSYAIGVDVAAGVGRDYSVIYVVSKKTYDLVALYRSKHIVTTALAKRIQEIAIDYNNALVLVESNNYGNVVLNELRHLSYTNIWRDNDKDWVTTSKSKTEMFENLKEMITSGHISWLDMITYGELRALKITDKNGIDIPDNMDSHADNALAMALAYICIKKVYVKQKSYLPDFIKEKRKRNIINNGGISIAGKSRY
jgi:hypothetical protein